MRVFANGGAKLAGYDPMAHPLLPILMNFNGGSNA